MPKPKKPTSKVRKVKKRILCEVCLDDEVKSTATYECVSCGTKHCEECRDQNAGECLVCDPPYLIKINPK